MLDVETIDGVIVEIIVGPQKDERMKADCRMLARAFLIPSKGIGIANVLTVFFFCFHLYIYMSQRTSLTTALNKYPKVLYLREKCFNDLSTNFTST